MIQLDATATRAALPWNKLIEAIGEIFKTGCEMPVRHHHDMAVPGEDDATLLLMPAWIPGRYMGVKMVSVFPGNAERGLPAIFGNYILNSGKTGEMLALIDGGELTARRTAAASAYAADKLARQDACSLLIVGTGRLAINLAQAHSSIRDIKRLMIWGRNLEKAKALCEELSALGFEAEPMSDLEAAVGEADIISCCTLSGEPIIQGKWLKAGTHLDLVGGFKPSMREADDEAIRRSRVFVDTRVGAMSEAGDITQPIENGALLPEDIQADLYDLARGNSVGRESEEDITFFKSVGAACEDLAGAILAYETTA